MRMVGVPLFSLGRLDSFLERRLAGAVVAYSQDNMRLMGKVALRRAIREQADIAPLRLEKIGAVTMRDWSLAERQKDPDVTEICAECRTGWFGDHDLWDAAVPEARLRPIIGRPRTDHLLLTADVIKNDRGFITALITSEDAAIRAHLARQQPIIAAYRRSLKARIDDAIWRRFRF